MDVQLQGTVCKYVKNHKEFKIFCSSMKLFFFYYLCFVVP